MISDKTLGVFRSVPPNEAQNVRYAVIRINAERLYQDLLDMEEHLDSRCLSIAKTKLEECAMWANKAISRGKNES